MIIHSTLGAQHEGTRLQSSVGRAKDLNESARFYQSVLGMELIPTYNFGFKTRYLRCGELQLHLFELEDVVPKYQRVAIDVDDFHAVLVGNLIRLALDRETGGAVVYEGSLQAHWLGSCRSISVAGSPRGRDLDIAAANKRSAADCS